LPCQCATTLAEDLPRSDARRDGLKLKNGAGARAPDQFNVVEGAPA
jgi:hypothetical protein